MRRVPMIALARRDTWALSYRGNLLETNLDDRLSCQLVILLAGIPQGLMPSFEDANGNPTSANLTINVVDNTNGVAEKYTIRYEPGVMPTPAGRSLKDLVDAINTGSWWWL